MAEKKELTVIGKAHEYVREYSTNGYSQVKAYMISHKCSYANAVNAAHRFHSSPACKEAFQAIIGNSVNEYFRHRDGVVLEAQNLYSQARAESLDTALKCLKFISELMGHIKVSDGETTNDNRKIINISVSDIKALKEITEDLKSINIKLTEDNGRQTGEVN